jgi:hypothetical protein
VQDLHSEWACARVLSGILPQVEDAGADVVPGPATCAPVKRLRIEPSVNTLIANNELPIITDVRYIEYKDDEYSWIKSHNGLLIHISRKLNDGSFVQPANIEEKSNDNKLKAVSDITIVWETCQDVNFLYELMQKQLKNIYERYMQIKK